MPIPNVPTQFLVSPGNGQVYLSWAPQIGATSASTGVPAASTGKYDVLRSLDGLTFDLLTSINQSQYFDTPSTGMLLYYSVRANGNNGQSAACQSIVTTVVNPGQTTLGAVRLAAQQKADMVNSDFISKQEWNDYINKSYCELYDLLIQTYADEYYVANPYTITIDGRMPALYNLPANFYKLLGTDLGLNPNNNQWITLKKYSFVNRNKYVFGNATISALGTLNLKYRITGNQINFIPVPANGQTIRLWYIPRPVTLLADYNVLDGISGWEEYVIVDVAIKALLKEESDATVLMARKEELRRRLEAAAQNRDAGMSECVTDVRGLDGNGWNGPEGFNGLNGGF